MNLQLVVDRLSAACPEIKTVGRIADFSAVETSQPANFPAAYVIPLKDRANSEIGLLSGASIERYFGVCIAVKNLRDTRGDHAQDALEIVRSSVMRALLDCDATPPDFPELNFVDGNLVGFIHNAIWWQDTFLNKFVLSF